MLYYFMAPMIVDKFSCSEWAKCIPKPFTLHYDPYTQSVDVLDSASSLKKLTSGIKYDMSVLAEAIAKF